MDAFLVEVERMLANQVPFVQMEDRIDRMALDEEAKAALWLLAWGGQESTVRRQTIVEALTFTKKPRG